MGKKNNIVVDVMLLSFHMNRKQIKNIYVDKFNFSKK